MADSDIIKPLAKLLTNLATKNDIERLEHKVETLGEKVETLDEKVETLGEKVGTLDEKVENNIETLKVLEKKLDKNINMTNGMGKVVGDLVEQVVARGEFKKEIERIDAIEQHLDFAPAAT